MSKILSRTVHTTVAIAIEVLGGIAKTNTKAVEYLGDKTGT